MQPDYVLVEYGVAAGAELLECGVDVDGVPQDDAVEHQVERAELVLHPLAVALIQLALGAVEHLAGERVAALLEVADPLHLAPVALVIDQMEDVEALVDPPVVLDRLPERRRVAVALQHPSHVVGPDRAGVDRGDDAQGVWPVAADLRQVKPPTGESFSGP